MDNNQPYPGADHGFGNHGGFAIGAQPGPVPPPPPHWPVQPGQWPPFHPPSTFPPHPLPFDPSRPPPGYYGGQQQQQSGPWPNMGQQGPMADRGQCGQGVPFTHYGPPHQPRFPPVSPGVAFSVDRRTPPSAPRVGQTTGDADAGQRLQDARWVTAFLQRRAGARPDAASACPAPATSVRDFRRRLCEAARALSELTMLCRTLRDHAESESADAWSESFARAAELRGALRDSVAALRDQELLGRVRRKLELIERRRARVRRRKAERAEETREEEASAARRAAAIDKFQAKQIQELEEKNRERELKLAADAVLSEVRKKQADAKRMTDILKALEKLRKLRKEAASRRGMFPEKECDEVFEGHLTRLRSLIRKRTAVYGAEEKALRVMLEGEQEEERKRDREKRLKKEREKLLLKKQEMESVLFGAELPPDHPLQPFQEYYTQAERSLPALIQIRREWDQFLVPVDHPDGTSIPQAWVLPDPPADDVWATALEK